MQNIQNNAQSYHTNIDLFNKLKVLGLTQEEYIILYENNKNLMNYPPNKLEQLSQQKRLQQDNYETVSKISSVQQFFMSTNETTNISSKSKISSQNFDNIYSNTNTNSKIRSQGINNQSNASANSSVHEQNIINLKQQKNISHHFYQAPQTTKLDDISYQQENEDQFLLEDIFCAQIQSSNVFTTLQCQYNNNNLNKNSNQSPKIHVNLNAVSPGVSQSTFQRPVCIQVQLLKSVLQQQSHDDSNFLSFLSYNSKLNAYKLVDGSQSLKALNQADIKFFPIKSIYNLNFQELFYSECKNHRVTCNTVDISRDVPLVIEVNQKIYSNNNQEQYIEKQDTESWDEQRSAQQVIDQNKQIIEKTDNISLKNIYDFTQSVKANDPAYKSTQTSSSTNSKMSAPQQEKNFIQKNEFSGQKSQNSTQSDTNQCINQQSNQQQISQIINENLNQIKLTNLQQNKPQYRKFKFNPNDPINIIIRPDQQLETPYIIYLQRQQHPSFQETQFCSAFPDLNLCSFQFPKIQSVCFCKKDEIQLKYIKSTPTTSYEQQQENSITKELQTTNNPPTIQQSKSANAVSNIISFKSDNNNSLYSDLAKQTEKITQNEIFTIESNNINVSINDENIINLVLDPLKIKEIESPLIQNLPHSNLNAIQEYSSLNNSLENIIISKNSTDILENQAPQLKQITSPDFQDISQIEKQSNRLISSNDVSAIENYIDDDQVSKDSDNSNQNIIQAFQQQLRRPPKNKLTQIINKQSQTKNLQNELLKHYGIYTINPELKCFAEKLSFFSNKQPKALTAEKYIGLLEAEPKIANTYPQKQYI